MKLYERFYGVLTSEQQKKCLEELNSSTWRTAESTKNSCTFWFKELIHNNFFNTFFLNRIMQLTEKKFVLDRLYANGQSHGQSGYLHIDSDQENYWTFLYYANPIWSVDWGGSTVFYKNEKEFDHAMFIPNSGIIFKSNLLHAGLEPTRNFNDVRMTVAFKLIEA